MSTQDYEQIIASAATFLNVSDEQLLQRLEKRACTAPRQFDQADWYAIRLDACTTIGYVRIEHAICQAYDRWAIIAGPPERSLARAAISLARRTASGLGAPAPVVLG